MKNPILTLGLSLAALTLAPLAAQAGNLSVHLRATYLETIDESDAFSALGINFAADSVSVSDKLIPEIDINYAFSDTLTAQLVLTLPQEHHVDLAGVGRLGSFKHLPPTLLLEYKAFPGQAFRPYVGAGVNYTLIFDSELSVAGIPLSLENASIGLAAQVGFDYTLSEKWALNVDLKKAMLATDVSVGGTKLTEAQLNPILYSLGLRYSF